MSLILHVKRGLLPEAKAEQGKYWVMHFLCPRISVWKHKEVKHFVQSFIEMKVAPWSCRNRGSHCQVQFIFSSCELSMKKTPVCSPVPLTFPLGNVPFAPLLLKNPPVILWDKQQASLLQCIILLGLNDLLAPTGCVLLLLHKGKCKNSSMLRKLFSCAQFTRCGCNSMHLLLKLLPLRYLKDSDARQYISERA